MIRRLTVVIVSLFVIFALTMKVNAEQGSTSTSTTKGQYMHKEGIGGTQHKALEQELKSLRERADKLREELRSIHEKIKDIEEKLRSSRKEHREQWKEHHQGSQQHNAQQPQAQAPVVVQQPLAPAESQQK